MHTERGSREYANLGRKSNMLMSSEHCGVKKAREKQKEREREAQVTTLSHRRRPQNPPAILKLVEKGGNESLGTKRQFLPYLKRRCRAGDGGDSEVTVATEEEK